MFKLQGCGTALITPFKQDYSVDYHAFSRLVKKQIAAGIDFLVPLGTTGETPCLEESEKLALLEIAVSEANGQMPIVAGAGSNCTKETIRNLELFTKVGVDAFLISTPYYNKPTQQGLYKHFQAIAAATDKAIVLYNVPGRTGVNMSAETCLRLAEIKNIVATKEASSNYAQISEIIRGAPSHFHVLSGNDDETLALYATGARGVISVAANVAPETMSNFAKLLAAGDFKAARAVHFKLMPLFKNCFVETNPIPIKAALFLMGDCENVLRSPLYAATKETLDLMAQTLSASVSAGEIQFMGWV